MKLKLLAVVFCLLGAGSMFAGVRVGVGIGFGYPAPYYVAPPPVPYAAPYPAYGPGYAAGYAPGYAPGYAWIGGNWYPNGGHYYWRGGYGAARPYAGARSVAPHYAGHNNYHGYWRR